MKMEKTPRYTQRERNMVLGFAAQYKDVIENKRTDAESNRKKDEVWRQISKEFNTRVYHQRSAKQLRQLYKNMKLLLKKDLCGDDRGNRSFMDLLNTLSQQESVAQYISEQMSPSGYSSNRPHKYDDEYDDSKLPSVGYDGMENDVIVIKSEDISDNEQSQNGGNPDDMDDDDDDCLSPKDIPEVCLEEEDDEIFATDLRQPAPHQQSANNNQRANNNASQQQQQHHPSLQQPEVTIQNVGGIRVGSIGSLANLKALQNCNNSALSITHASSNISGNGNNNTNANNTSGNSGRQQTAAEQAQQHLLLNGLGLSAVHAPTLAPTPPSPPTAAAAAAAAAALPTLQRANISSSSNSNNNNNTTNSINNAVNQLLWNFNNSHNNNNNSSSNNFGHRGSTSAYLGSHSNSNNHRHHHHHSNSNSNNSGSGANSANNRNNEYMQSLAIEERKRKIELLNAQIEYWKTLTKKLDTNTGHNPTPTCLCHFPGKVNGLPTPQTNSS